MFTDLCSERLQLRLSPETLFRIRSLANIKGVTMSQFIRELVDDAWMDQCVLTDFLPDHYII